MFTHDILRAGIRLWGTVMDVLTGERLANMQYGALGVHENSVLTVVLKSS